MIFRSVELRGDGDGVVVDLDLVPMERPDIAPKRDESGSSSSMSLVALGSGGRHASTSNRTTIFRPSKSCLCMSVGRTSLILGGEQTHVCYDPVVTRPSFASRGRDGHSLFKVEPIRTAGPRLLFCELFPPIQQNGLRTGQLHVDPKVSRWISGDSIDPPQELPQSVSIRDDVDGRPVEFVVFLCP